MKSGKYRIDRVVIAAAAALCLQSSIAADELHADCSVGGEQEANWTTIQITGVVAPGKKVRRYLANGRREKGGGDKISFGDLPLPAAGVRNSRGLVCLRTGSGEAIWVQGSSLVVSCEVVAGQLAGETSGAGTMGLGTGSCKQ